jgi:hypothetical protein
MKLSMPNTKIEIFSNKKRAPFTFMNGLAIHQNLVTQEPVASA